MRALVGALFAIAVVLTVGSGAVPSALAGDDPCSAADVNRGQAAVAAACHSPAATSHQDYVRCALRAVDAAVEAGSVPSACAWRLRHAARRSYWGRLRFSGFAPNDRDRADRDHRPPWSCKTTTTSTTRVTTTSTTARVTTTTRIPVANTTTTRVTSTTTSTAATTSTTTTTTATTSTIRVVATSTTSTTRITTTTTRITTTTTRITLPTTTTASVTSTTTTSTSTTTTTTLLSTDGAAAGEVHVFQTANSSFDSYTQNPTPAEQQWMRDHYWRMLTYYPYFDSRLAWFPNAWVYQDLYAIYPGTSLASAHPEWILRDASGNALYIPYGCGGGTCPQYAADVGDPGFRSWWIGEAQTRMAFGYKGIFVDDVNMRMQVSDGDGNAVAPWDSRLGRTMTVTDWRRYVAEFTELIRAALPSAEIVHNQVWFFAPTTDPYVQRAIAAADVIEIERGFNDTGIQAGSGTYGFETLAAYADYLHGIGKGGVFDVEVTWGREYALATYFLVSAGSDLLGPDNGTQPDAWWSGYDVKLGAPLGPRYQWNGLFRRDFAAGIVLVNQPQQPTVTVQLGQTYQGLDGQLKASVSLGGADGVVLLVP